MMIATNWGVYEICERHAQFIDPADDRDMEIRARDKDHLKALRKRFRGVGPILDLEGIADFPYRVFITRDDLARMLASLAYEIDYVQFKKDAKNKRLYKLLCDLWTKWLNAYPQGSIYSTLPRKH